MEYKRSQGQKELGPENIRIQRKNLNSLEESWVTSGVLLWIYFFAEELHPEV